MRGIIALDIDGTITVHHHHLEPQVAKFFKSLTEQGWVLVFITGRTFAWGYEVLEGLDFPYYFAVHNGAVLFHMPSKQIISKQQIHRKSISELDAAFAKHLTDYAIYSEVDDQVVCYFRPDRLSSHWLDYLKGRSQAFNEIWIPVQTYTDLPEEQFNALKFFTTEEEAEIVAKQLEMLNFHAPIIKDPFNHSVRIIQATHTNVSKGKALETLKAYLSVKGAIIAAGDDNNDASMLEAADIRIVMETAPEQLLKQAHIIAPPASEMGIIEGLTKAIEKAHL